MSRQKKRKNTRGQGFATSVAARPQSKEQDAIGTIEDLAALNNRLIGDKQPQNLKVGKLKQVVDNIQQERGSGFNLEFSGNPPPPEADAAELENELEQPTTPDGQELISLTPAELQLAINRAVDERLGQSQATAQETIDQMQREHELERHRLQSDLQDRDKRLEASKAEEQRVKSFMRTLGYSTPQALQPQVAVSPNRSQNYRVNYNQLILPASSEPVGAALDFSNMLSRPDVCPVKTATHRDGTFFTKNTYALNGWFLENKKYLELDLERLLKGNGFLKGPEGLAAAGQTSGLNLPGEFLDYLDIYMRLTHSEQFSWWQFVFEGIDLGQGVGNRVLVPRYENLDTPNSVDDFLLDTPQVTNSISQATQGLQQVVSPIDLFGYGLGRGTSVSNRVISLSEFISRYTLTDLMRVIQNKLMQNYHAFEDMFIRRPYQTTNTTFYNKNGELETDPTNVLANEDGTATEEFLNSAYSQLVTDNVPFYDNSCYAFVAPPLVVNQIKRSLDDKIDAPNEAMLMEVTNILGVETINDGLQRTNGFVGKYQNVMIFQSTTASVGNPISAGNPNNPEGVDIVGFGAGGTIQRTVYDSYIFGKGAVGRGIGMPAQIRSDDRGRFDLSLDFIWRSIEGAGAMDVQQVGTPSSNGNPASADYNGQQTRVYRLRTTQEPVT